MRSPSGLSTTTCRPRRGRASALLCGRPCTGSSSAEASKRSSIRSRTCQVSPQQSLPLLHCKNAHLWASKSVCLCRFGIPFPPAVGLSTGCFLVKLRGASASAAAVQYCQDLLRCSEKTVNNMYCQALSWVVCVCRASAGRPGHCSSRGGSCQKAKRMLLTNHMTKKSWASGV